MTDSLTLEDFLPYRLKRLADAVSRDFSRNYKELFGLTRPEWRALATLGQFGTMTATEIGAHSAMHKTKVSRAVAELEERGWLSRERDLRDRRVEKLELTASGLQAYRQLIPIAGDFQKTLLEMISPDAQAALLSGLAALEESMLATDPADS